MMNSMVRELYRHLLKKPCRDIGASIVNYSRENNNIRIIIESSFDMSHPLYYCLTLNPKDGVQEYIFIRRERAERWLRYEAYWTLV
jgi:hypothetical protein